MLGTGMPTLAPIARTPFKGRTPVLSCMFCIIWLSLALAAGRKPDADDLLTWVRGDWWRERMGLPTL